MYLELSINARIIHMTGNLEQTSKMMRASKLVYYMLSIPALHFWPPGLLQHTNIGSSDIFHDTYILHEQHIFKISLIVLLYSLVKLLVTKLWKNWRLVYFKMIYSHIGPVFEQSRHWYLHWRLQILLPMWIYNEIQRLNSFNGFLFVQQSLIYPFLLVVLLLLFIVYLVRLDFNKYYY